MAYDLSAMSYQLNKLPVKVVFAIAIGLLLIVYMSGLPVDVNGDAAKYASIGKEIYLTDHWLEIKDKGEPYLEKPPYLFWTSALSFKLFGVYNFSYKLPVLLLSTWGVFALYRLGKIFYNRNTGLLAAGLLITSLAFLFYHNDIHTDTCLTSWVIISIWQFAKYLQTRHIFHFIAAFSACGLAMLTKGPIGLVIPAFAVGVHLILQGKWKSVLSPIWLAGIPIIGLWLFPYLVGLYRQFGLEGIEFFFWTNNFGRITGSLYENNSDLTYYIHSLLWLFLPWSLATLTAIFLEIRTLIRNGWRLNEGEGFAIGSFLCYFPIISVAQFKSPNYLMVILPLLALLTAKWILNWHPDSKMFRFFSAWHRILFILLLGTTLFILFYPFHPLPPGKIIAVFALLLTGLFPILRINHPANRLLGLVAIGMVTLFFTFNIHLFPAINQYHSGAVAARMVNENSMPEDRFYTRHRNYNSTHFYANRKVENLAEFRKLSEALSRPGGWLYTTEDGKKELEKLSFEPKEVILLPHHFLRRPKLKILFPGSRESVLERRYLIRW